MTGNEPLAPAQSAMLADRAELGDLVAAYAFAADRKDGAGLALLFTPGGGVWVPAALSPQALRPVADVPAASGRPELTRLEPADLPGTLSRFQRTRHLVYQSSFTIHAETAEGETYGSAHHLYRRDGTLRDNCLALRYLDEFARTESGWRFRRRELVVDWLSDQPVRLIGPTGQPLRSFP
jgi:hypothetical protein